MKPHALTLDVVLRSVDKHRTAPEVAAHLGCDVTTARRHLRRAENAELVTESQGVGVRVWELTARGHERLARRKVSC